MPPLKVLVIGFPAEKFTPDESIMWLVKSDSPDQLSQRELYRLTKTAVDSADLILIENYDRVPTFDDGVILQLAYSNQTPILAVGDDVPFSETFIGFVDNVFNDLTDAIDHITAHYL